MAKTRRFVQILILFAFFILFLLARYPYEHGLSSDFFLRLSPLAPVFYFIDNLELPFFFWPAVVVLLLTPVLGRFFCGWICPLGTSLDISHRLVPSPSNKKARDWTRFRWVKFAILAGTIVLAIFSLNIWGYFDPLAIFTRLTAAILYPLFTLVSEGLIILGTQISFFEDISFEFYDWYKSFIMPEKQSYVQTLFWLVFLFTLIFGLERLTRRFWCRNICPAGAWLGFLSQIRFYERIVGPSCPVCNRCQVDCKMNAIPEGRVKETNKVECIECFNCGEKCPPNSKAITYRFKWKPYRIKPDFSRRQFIGSAAFGLAGLGLLGIHLRSKQDDARLIRPPGSLPEDEFLDRCIRCLECVRICQSNGRCLQPAGFEHNLIDFWTPIAVMRQGYCEFNCTLCGEICPTDAILPLPLDIKQKSPMGLAYFDKNLCIPFERHKDCIVCEEHCPTPDKAIKFDQKEAVLPDGTRRLVKYPFVIRELCIGCGICEEKCPLPNLPGIFVTRENEKRYESVPAWNQNEILIPRED